MKVVDTDARTTDTSATIIAAKMIEREEELLRLYRERDGLVRALKFASRASGNFCYSIYNQPNFRSEFEVDPEYANFQKVKKDLGL